MSTHLKIYEQGLKTLTHHPQLALKITNRSFISKFKS